MIEVVPTDQLRFQMTLPVRNRPDSGAKFREVWDEKMDVVYNHRYQYTQIASGNVSELVGLRYKLRKHYPKIKFDIVQDKPATLWARWEG